MAQPVFRFAPSPNGFLHLGHAYSALYSQKICKANDGLMLLRLENTDIARCRSEYEDAIVEDLAWIGFEWQGAIRRQSDHFDVYAGVLGDLENEDLAYPAFMTRRQIKHHIATHEENTGEIWPRDPDGAVHYPVNERHLDEETRQKLRSEFPNHAIRLNIEKAQDWLKRQHCDRLFWREMPAEDCKNQRQIARHTKIERIKCEPQLWGDLVLGRRDIPASYHLACVVDDNLQGVTHVVRGKDIFPATAIHRLLQEILGYDDPLYYHHELIVDDKGIKYSKRHGDTSLRQLRAAGMQPSDIYKMIGIAA